VRHELGDFLAGDRGIGLCRDVAVQQEPEAEQHDRFHPAQGTLLAEDARTGAAADGLRVNRAQHSNLAFVVELEREEQFGEPAAEDQLVVEEGCPEFLVAAAIHVRTLQQLHERLAHLHGEHAGVAREQRGAVHEGVTGGDGERIGAEVVRLRSRCHCLGGIGCSVSVRPAV
jgi:hypothetical protein